MKEIKINEIYRDLKIIKCIGKRKRKWQCKCICGKIIEVYTSQLLSRRKVSCGCRNKKIQHSFAYITKEKACIARKKIKKPNKNNRKSFIRGVCWDNNRNLWIASIYLNGTLKFLGRFKNFNDAVEARKKAEAL